MQLTATPRFAVQSYAVPVVRTRFGETQTEPGTAETSPVKPKGYLRRQIEHYGFWTFTIGALFHVAIIVPGVATYVKEIPGLNRFFPEKVKVKSLNTYDALDAFTRKLPEGDFDIQRDTSNTGVITTTITKK